MVLEGLKVVSFCHYLQGPAAMQYLADMGADVIKIEPPQGAFERHWAGAGSVKVGGVSALYLCANRNVRSLAIDLKHAEAREVVFRLLDESHVLAENFRPATLERLGFGYEAVRSRKPDIIYASASGFGATGPYAARPGQDLLVQAMSGLAAVGGDGRTPVPAGITAGDQHGAALLAMAITGAYSRWQATGQGTRVEATLFGAAVDLQMELIVAYHASGLGRAGIERDGHLATWFHEAPYGVYRMKDGHIALSMTNLQALSEALGDDDFSGVTGLDAFRDRDRIAEATAVAIARRTFADLVASFDAKGIWYARVEDYDDLLVNPQAIHNGVFQKVEVNGAEATLVSHPIRYDGEVPGMRSLATAPGADTCAILGHAGFTDAELADLIRNKVVFVPGAGIMTSDAGYFVSIGDAVEFSKTVAEADVYLFAGITGDFSSNHVNEQAMSRSKYGRRIAHGALMVGFMSTCSTRLIETFGAAAIGKVTAVSLGYDRVRFLAPVFFGDTVTARYTITRLEPERQRTYAEIKMVNQSGVEVAVAEHILKWVDDNPAGS